MGRGGCQKLTPNVHSWRNVTASERNEKVRLAEANRTNPNTRSRCPQKDSNLRTWLRRPVLYPLSYGGATQKGYQSSAALVTCVRVDRFPAGNGRQEVVSGGNLTECDARFGAGARRGR
jgi:hypothetical protein